MAVVEPAQDPFHARPTRVRWLIFALICATSFILYLHRYTWAMVKKDVGKTFSWKTDTLGDLDSAFNISYASGQIPGGMLGDWFGTHWVLGAMVALWSIALYWMANATGYGDMWASRFCFGLGQAGCYPNLSKVTKSWFPWSVRTTVQGLVSSFSGRMGGAVSYILLGTVLMGYWQMDWRTATISFSAIGIVFAVVFLVLFRGTPRQHFWSNEAEADAVAVGDVTTSSVGRSQLNWSLALRDKNVRALVFQQFTCAYVDNVFSAWIPFYLLQQKQVEMTSAGWMAALPLVGGAIGGMTGGSLQQALIWRTKNPRWCRSLVGLTGNTMATVCMLLALTFDSALAVVLTFAVLKFFADWAQPTCWATVTDIGGRSAASVFAIINTSGSIGGIVSGPIMGRMLLYFSGSSTEPTDAGWTALFISLAIIYLASAVSWLFVDCTCPIDRSEKAENGQM